MASLRIKDLRGIPAVYSEFVFCEFTLDGQESHLVLPKGSRQLKRARNPGTSSFTYASADR